MAEDKDIFDFNAPAEEVESPTLDKDTTEVSDGFDFDTPAEMVSPTDIVSIGTGEIEPPKPQEFQRTQLSPEQENDFQNFMNTEPAVLEWKEAFKNEYGEYPDIEDADYDYRGAWQSGQVPVSIADDPVPHWGSFGVDGKQLKSPDHPTRWKSDYFELTGDDPDETDVTKASAVKALKAEGFPVSNYMTASELNDPQVKIPLRRLREENPDKFNSEVDEILKKENKFDEPIRKPKDRLDVYVGNIARDFTNFMSQDFAPWIVGLTKKVTTGGLETARDIPSTPSFTYDFIDNSPQMGRDLGDLLSDLGEGIANFADENVQNLVGAILFEDEEEVNKRLEEVGVRKEKRAELQEAIRAKRSGEPLDLIPGTKPEILDRLSNNKVTKILEETATQLDEESNRYDKTIEYYFKTGEYGKLLGSATYNAAKSVVPSLAAGFAGQYGLVGMGLTTAARKKRELDEVSNLPEATKTASASLHGLLEYVTERVGTHQIAGMMKSIYKEFGEEAGEQIAKRQFSEILHKYYKDLGLYVAPVHEGVSEVANQWGQNWTVILSGENPELDPMTGLPEAFTSGLILAGPGPIMQGVEDVRQRQRKKGEAAMEELFEDIAIRKYAEGKVPEAKEITVEAPVESEVKPIKPEEDAEKIGEVRKEAEKPTITPTEVKEGEPVGGVREIDRAEAAQEEVKARITPEEQVTPGVVTKRVAMPEYMKTDVFTDTDRKAFEEQQEKGEFDYQETPEGSLIVHRGMQEGAVGMDVHGGLGNTWTIHKSAAEGYGDVTSMVLPKDAKVLELVDQRTMIPNEKNLEVLNKIAGVDPSTAKDVPMYEAWGIIEEAAGLEGTELAEKVRDAGYSGIMTEGLDGTEVYMLDPKVLKSIEKPKEEKVKKRKVSKPTALKEAQSIQSLEKSVEKGDLDLGDPDVLARVKTAQKNNLETNEDATEIDLEVEAKKAEAAKKFKEEEQAKLEQPKGAGFMFLDVAGFFDKKGKVKPARPISALAKKYFTKEGDIPAKAFKEHVQAEARLRARQFDIEKSVKDMIKRTERTYGRKLKEEEREQLANILENIGQTEESLNAAMSELGKNMPKEMIPILVDMRQQIDNYTDELSKLNMIGVEMEEKFDKNRGYYVTRTYKKHSDRKWTWENIPAKIKEDAFNVVADLYPEFSVDEVTGTLKSYLADKDIVSSVISNANSLKDVNRDILKKRSAFLTDNPEIRAFLGENKDPFYNYAVSLTKMSEMIERGKMMQNIVDIGVKDGWLAEKPSDEKNLIKKADYKAKYKTKPDTKELADYYTTPEIAEALSRSFAGNTLNSKPLRVWMRGVTTVKMAKTVFSLKGIVRNFLSNPINAVANGNWNVQQIAPELTRRLKNKDVKDDLYRELYERGVIGDTVTKAELIKNIQELSDKLSYISNTDENVLAKQARKTKKIMMDLYGLGDDVWKAYRYVSEYTRYENAFKKTMSDKDAANAARTKAVDVLHKTSAYYANLPLALQNFRKIPFSNTFISWPYLTLTNAIGSAQIATQELKTPGIRHIGAQRMVGLMGALGAIPTIAALINRGSGQDEEDMEAWRRFLPEFWKNDIIAIDEVKDGKALYVNRSFMDYYGVVTTPINTIRRKLLANGTVASEDLIGVAGEFAGNFISYDILFDKMTDLKNNQSRTTGFPIYNEQDDWLSQWRDISGYMLETFEPGTLTDVRRIYKDYRIGEDWQAKAEGVFKGTQVRTIDPIKSMDKYKLYDYRDAINNSRKIYTDELRSFNRLKDPNERDREALKDAKKRALNSINKIVNEIKADRRALNRLAIKGADNTLWDLMTDKRFDTDIKYAVFDGYKLKLSEEGKIE